MGKKRTGFVTLCPLLMLFVWGISAVAQAQNPVEEISQARPEILFAVGEWPPMIAENAIGYGILARRVSAVFEAMGYQVRYEFLPWQRAYQNTQRGEYAATFPWVWSDQRDKQVLFPRHPIARTRQKGFYKKSRFPDGLQIDDVADIKSLGLLPVGVASYWYEGVFRNHHIQPEIVTTSGAAWRFLEADRADIYFEEEDVGWFDIARILGDYAPERYATTGPVLSENMFVLFSRSHPEGVMLRDAFDAFMETPKGHDLCKQWDMCERAVKNHP